jgi:WD40 repeat protein
MYVCCRRGDWDRGLPLLARGNDPALHAAAVMDLASPTRPEAQVEVADTWWTLAATQAGHVRAALQRRAGYWYQQALPHLTGLTRGRVKENLKGISPHPPGLRLPDPVGELLVMEGHHGPVTGVAVTPDGRGVVTGSLDGTVRLWSLETGAESRRLSEPPGEIHGVAIAPDGRRVLAGGTHGIALWNLEKGLALYRTRQPGPVQRVAFAPSGEQFVSAGDRGVGVYDVEPPRLRLTLPAGPGWAPARGVALLPRGLLLFVGGDGRVRLGEVDKAADTAPFTRAGALCGALSPDCRLLVLGGTDKTVRLLDLIQVQQFRTLRGHTRPVTSVAFSADGRRVLSGSEDRTVRLWEVASGREVERFAWHTDTVLSVAFAPNGRLAVSGSADQTVRVWLLPR